MFGCATLLIRLISFLKLPRSCKLYSQAFLSPAPLELSYCTHNSAGGAVKDSQGAGSNAILHVCALCRQQHAWPVLMRALLTATGLSRKLPLLTEPCWPSKIRLSRCKSAVGTPRGILALLPSSAACVEHLENRNSAVSIAVNPCNTEMAWYQ